LFGGANPPDAWRDGGRHFVAMNQVQDEHRTERMAAWFTVTTCLIGMVLGLWLSWVKLQSQQCGGGILSQCGEESALFSCTTVFESAWATPFGLPVTMFATGLYGVALIAALAIARRKHYFYGIERVVLFACAWIAVLATLIMSGHAYYEYTKFCKLCATLYLASVLFFICALWTTRTKILSGLKDVLGFGWLAKGGHRGLVVSLSVFCVLVVSQVWAYNSTLCHHDPNVTCAYEMLPVLPKTDADRIIQIGAEEPEWVFATFIDPSCNFCRKQHKLLDKLLKTKDSEGTPYGEKVQVRFFHYPRQNYSDCVNQDFKNSFPSHNDAKTNFACKASRAIECVNVIDHGKVVAFMDGVLELQDTKVPYFTLEKLVKVATGLGVEEGLVRVCMDQSALNRPREFQEIPARIQEHTTYAHKTIRKVRNAKKVSAQVIKTPTLFAITGEDFNDPVGKRFRKKYARAIRFEGDTMSFPILQRLLEDEKPEGCH
jgi:uncharacterized membrane protein